MNVAFDWLQFIKNAFMFLITHFASQKLVIDGKITMSR